MVLETILDELRTFCKEADKKSDNGQGRTILSFAVEIDDFDSAFLDDYVCAREFSFLINRAETDSLRAGYGSVLNIDTDRSIGFRILEEQLDSLNVINNFDEQLQAEAPLFFGWIKFNDRTGSEWNEFGDFQWFVPRITVFKQKGKAWFIINTLTGDNGSCDSDIFRDMEKCLNEFTKDAPAEPDRTEQYLKLVSDSKNERADWIAAVTNLQKEIRAGSITKGVLARREEYQLERKPSAAEIFSGLHNSQKGSIHFILKAKNDIFFGASPEVLLEMRNDKIKTEALAGTRKRSSDPIEEKQLEEELCSSSKELHEHNVVVDFLLEALQRHADSIEYESEPAVKKFTGLMHLNTPVKAALRKDATQFDLLDDLFPTPAVCGYPKEKALGIIENLEYFSRGLYSGVAGWFNHSGSCEYIVSLRSGLLKNNKLFAYAGCGIMADSDPVKEWNETQIKFKTIKMVFNAS